MNASDSPVLVVGGRTTGLMMAAELARHGVPVRIVDKSPGIDPHARATVLHSRTLEILQGLGLAGEIIETAERLGGFQLYANGKHVASSQEDPIDSPFPCGVAQSQAKTERVLEQHLNRLGVQVERSTEMTSLEQDSHGVRATLKHADGREETVETLWLIGCDGAHSTVRHLTEVEFPGVADPHPYLLADVAVEGPLAREDVYIFLSDEGDLFLFIHEEGRRLIAANEPRGAQSTAPPTLDEVQAVVSRRGLANLRLSDPRWLTRFHIHYRLAPHYRHGRVFLAGDAAHIHSLVGGHGMNTGIQDAHNLAWKLALVWRGVAPESWLDTYEAERRGIAEDVLAVTKHATEQAELFANLSPQERLKLLEHMIVPESEKQRARRHAEEVDLDYRASAICVEHEGHFDGGPHAGSEAPDATPITVGDRTCTFLDLLTGPRHRLILFAGDAPLEQRSKLAAAAQAVAEAHDHWIEVFVVGKCAAPCELPAGITAIEDRHGALHARYAADAACAYLIRPDGYIACRSRELDCLERYLERVF